MRERLLTWNPCLGHEKSKPGKAVHIPETYTHQALQGRTEDFLSICTLVSKIWFLPRKTGIGLTGLGQKCSVRWSLSLETFPFAFICLFPISYIHPFLFQYIKSCTVWWKQNTTQNSSGWSLLFCLRGVGVLDEATYSIWGSLLATQKAIVRDISDKHI